ncbi:MAG: hypothetical protein Q8K78_08100 [Planctomycetaceae bacterium]|nr:hypothetical protein [Planctomycetaceae bacterium]
MMRSVLLTMCAVFSGIDIHAAGADIDTWKEKLAVSQKAWEAAGKKCQGDYSYQVTVAFYSGTTQTTTVVVRDHKVTERKFARGVVAKGKPPAEPVTEWVETAADLGKHEGPAAKPKTMDELYTDAAKLLDGPIAKHEQLTVSFDKDGLLKECFTIDTRIADDNPRKGVAIDRLILAKK